ncbi:MAG: CoA transferase, partial [Dehalococcoidia bacterium]|nr:CoA transferase [Dehalococcoidia bacterium]
MLPLEGVKVIDMSHIFMGPGAALHMADQGAEVIKVEPMTGDAVRWRWAMPGLGEPELGKAFLGINRNKRSIAVDVRTTEGQEIVHRLAMWADALIVNFRPGAE